MLIGHTNTLKAISITKNKKKSSFAQIRQKSSKYKCEFRTKTKKATINLISSVLSLIACVALFFGMTFAWFTDSVTSGKNKIQAGNLDVTFEYSKTLEANSWKDVTNTTEDIFTDANGNDILWEPGAANIVYLKVKNAGTLALKYNLGINIVSEVAGTNVDGNSFKLSNYIQFGQVELKEGVEIVGDRCFSECTRLSEIILPEYILSDDNCFSLLPHETRTISYRKLDANVDECLSVEAYTLA